MINQPNFCDLPENYADSEKAKIVILPVPYDGTSTWGKGADKGPAAIIEASANMELYDIETDSEVYKQGIFTEKAVKEHASPEKMVEVVQKKVSELLKKKLFTVLLGGEHSVSIGTIYAHAEKYKNMTVLQFDAHSDLRSEYHNSKNNHACIMARAQEVAKTVQVGIRSMDSSEKKNLAKSTVFFAEKIQEDKQWQEKVLASLTENVYITIDLDVFDPAYLPATGTPEPGGLDWYQVTSLLRKVAEKKKIVGFDVVELAPNKMSAPSDFLAAKLVYKLLSYIF